MPEVVDDAVEPAELRPVLGGEAAEREPVEEAAAREQHHEEDREEEPGHRVATTMAALVHTSNEEPSRTALAIPRGIDTRYTRRVVHSPREIDTSILSTTRRTTDRSRK